MNKEEFIKKLKKWYMNYFHEDEANASAHMKEDEDYINNAISSIEEGADEIVEFNNLTYLISIV